MICFDCQQEPHAPAAASGVCSTCGAGICHQHTLIDPNVEEVHSVGNPTVSRHPGRRLHCRACAPEHAQIEVRQA